MRWNKNGYTVTVRINLFAVGDGGGDLCTADPGSSHADIACFVVDTLAGVICRSTVTAGITGNAGVDNHRGGRGVVDCPTGDCGAVAWAEMAAYVHPSAVLLAIPHVAFATSALLLFADGGLLYDYFPYFTPPMDKLGIGLGFTLAVKESAFLLWILAAVLSEKRLLQQVIVLDSLGYSRWQCLNWLLLPSVAPALAMAMLAIVAWSLSVVDVAIILGPGNPPTLAVISWQWLTQGDADQQTKGALASLLLMLLLAAYVLLGYLLWCTWRRTIPRVDGVRKPATPLLPGITLASFLPLTSVLCVVLLAILADQSTINSEALINSLTMGWWRHSSLCSCYCCGWNGGHSVASCGYGCRFYYRHCRWWRASTRWRYG